MPSEKVNVRSSLDEKGAVQMDIQIARFSLSGTRLEQETNI